MAKKLKGIRNEDLYGRRDPVVQALEGQLRKGFRSAPSASLYNPESTYYTPRILDANDPYNTLGKSSYDDELGALVPYDPEEYSSLGNIEENRYDEQSWATSLASGVGKMVGKAATTFLNDTVGLIVGGISAAANQQWSKIWDNGFTRAMDSVDQALEEMMPNYRSEAQKDSPWYSWDNLASMNFWADNVIKNLGFTLGSVGSMALGTGVLSKASRMGKLGQILTKTAGREAGLNVVNGTLAATYSAIGEAAVEAFQNKKEIMQEGTMRIDTSLSKKAKELYDAYSQGQISDAAFEKGMDDINNQRQAAIQDLELYANSAGNKTMLANIPMLAFNDYMTFGKGLVKGFTTAKRMGNVKANVGRSQMAGAVAEGKLGYEAAKTWQQRIFGKYDKKAVAIGRPIRESLEEMGQKFISETSKDYYLTDFNNHKIVNLDDDAQEEALGLLNSIQSGFKNSFGSLEAWEEGFVGGLTGAMRMPTIGKKKDGSIGVIWAGGIKEAMDDYAADKEARRVHAESLDKLVKSDKFRQSLQNISRERKFQSSLDQAVENDDKKAYFDTEDAMLAETVGAFYNAGRLDDLRTIIRASTNVDQENLDQIIQSTTEKIDSFNANTEVQQKIAQAKQEVENIDTQLAQLQEEYEKFQQGPSVTKEQFEQMAPQYEKQIKDLQDMRTLQQSFIDQNSTLVGPYIKDDGTVMSKEEIVESLQKKQKRLLDEVDKYEEIREDYNLRFGDRISNDNLNELSVIHRRIDRAGERGGEMLRRKEVVQAAMRAAQVNGIFEAHVDESTQTRSRERVSKAAEIRKELNDRIKSLKGDKQHNNEREVDRLTKLEKALGRYIDSKEQSFYQDLKEGKIDDVMNILTLFPQALEDTLNYIKEQDGESELITDLMDVALLSRNKRQLESKLMEYLVNPAQMDEETAQVEQEQKNKAANKEANKRATEVIEATNAEILDRNAEMRSGIEGADEALYKQALDKIKKAEAVGEMGATMAQEIENSEVLTDEEKALALQAIEELRLKADSVEDFARFSEIMEEKRKAFEAERDALGEEAAAFAQEREDAATQELEDIHQRSKKAIEEAEKANPEDMEALDEQAAEAAEAPAKDDSGKDGPVAAEPVKPQEEPEPEDEDKGAKSERDHTTNLSEEAIENRQEEEDKSKKDSPFSGQQATYNFWFPQQYFLHDNSYQGRLNRKVFYKLSDQELNDILDPANKGKEPTETTKAKIKYIRAVGRYLYEVNNANNVELKEEDEVEYVIDSKLSKEAGNIVILMRLKKSGQIIGALENKSFRSAYKQADLVEFIDKMHEQYKQAGMPELFVSTETSKISQVLTGKTMYNASYQYISDSPFAQGPVTFAISYVDQTSDRNTDIRTQANTNPNTPLTTQESDIRPPLRPKAGQTYVLVETNAAMHSGRRYVLSEVSIDNYTNSGERNPVLFQIINHYLEKLASDQQFSSRELLQMKDQLMELLSVKNLYIVKTKDKLIIKTTDWRKEGDNYKKNTITIDLHEPLENRVKTIKDAFEDTPIQVSRKYINTKRFFNPLTRREVDYNSLLSEITKTNLQSLHTQGDWFTVNPPSTKKASRVKETRVNPTAHSDKIVTFEHPRVRKQDGSAINVTVDLEQETLVSDDGDVYPMDRVDSQYLFARATIIAQGKSLTEDTSYYIESLGYYYNPVIDQLTSPEDYEMIVQFEEEARAEERKKKDKEKESEPSEESTTDKQEEASVDEGKSEANLLEEVLSTGLAAPNSIEEKVLNMLPKEALQAIADKKRIQGKQKLLQKFIQAYDSSTNSLTKSVDEIINTKHREVNEQEEVETMDQEKESKWLATVLPQLSSKERLKFVQRVAGRKDAWGSYYNGVITISNTAARGTIYHEAFHAVVDMYLNDSEIDTLFREGRKRYGNLAKEAIEEALAEDFRRYVQNEQYAKYADIPIVGSILKLFSKLKRFIKHIVGKESYIDNLFYQINSGKFKNIKAQDSTVESPTSIMSIRQYHNHKYDLENLTEEQKAILEENNISLEDFDTLTNEEKENLMYCYS